MHMTSLRKVGGSIMLAVPPPLLRVLNLRAGENVNIGIEDGRLVVEPKTKPSYTLDELLAQCDDAVTSIDDHEWIDAGPVGKELL